MAKKKVIIIPWENTSKWLCTFNDLMTLLLTFFVLILSMSSLSASKVRELQAQLIDALGMMEFGKSEDEYVIQQLFNLDEIGKKQKIVKTLKQPVPELKKKKDHLLAKIPPELQLKEFAVLKQEGKKEYNEAEIIFKQFEKLINENYFEPGITVIKRERGIVLRLKENILFKPGESALMEKTYRTLAKISPILKKTAMKISIEGHTDTTPIKSEQFPSNWELSMDRAIKVLDFFINTAQIAPEKFSVAGYGDSLPVAPNNTPENRAKNRRIDLVFANF